MGPPDRPAAALDETVDRLRNISASSLTLLDQIGPVHLTRDLYRAIARDFYLGSVSAELRTASLIVPLQSPAGELVYWIPPGTDDAIRAALTFLRQDIPRALVDRVRERLEAIGYLSESNGGSE